MTAQHASGRDGAGLSAPAEAVEERVHAVRRTREVALPTVLARCRAAGLAVDLKVYPGGRHEMLNETNRDEVVADLLAWLDATLSRRR